MSTPFNPNTGTEALAVISRATMPRDEIDNAAVSHVVFMEAIERFGDQAKVAHALVHARSLTVQAIDSADRPIGEPCVYPEDVVHTWQRHRDAGVALPIGHHSGQTVIGIRADSFDAWSAWLADMAGFTRPREDSDGRSYGTERGLREMGRYSLLTRVPHRRPVNLRTVSFMGDRGLREASKLFGLSEAPRKPQGPVTALWVVGHRSNFTPAGEWAAARPDVRGRKLANGVQLLAKGDLVPVASAVGADTKIIGDVPPQIEGTSTGFDALSSILLIVWKS